MISISELLVNYIQRSLIVIPMPSSPLFLPLPQITIFCFSLRFQCFFLHIQADICVCFMYKYKISTCVYMKKNTYLFFISYIVCMCIHMYVYTYIHCSAEICSLCSFSADNISQQLVIIRVFLSSFFMASQYSIMLFIQLISHWVASSFLLLEVMMQ